MNRLLISTILLTLVVTTDCVAAETFRVRSQYRQNASDIWTADTIWHFEGKGPQKFAVRMNENPDPSFELIYSDGQRLETVVQKMFNNPDQADRIVARASEGRIMLSQGFPLPFDDLDPWNLNDGNVQIKKEAGGVGFVLTVQRQSEPFSLEAAIADGMVPPGFAQPFDGISLTMISAIKDGRLLVRQLWVAGERWWRYEETPFRRSWRTGE